MTKPDDAWSVAALKARWRSAVEDLTKSTPEPFCRVEGEHGVVVFVTEPFAKAVRRESLTSTPLLWKALKNLRYGYDLARAMSPGGRDGIFHVSPDFKPRNAMVEKLYDHCRETEKGQNFLAKYLGHPKTAQGVRVVSHGLRLLGFVERRATAAPVIVLVDVDVNKR